MKPEENTLTPGSCANCGNVFTGNYCSNCGQERFGHGDKSFLHLLEEVFHFITHFEGSFWLTLKTVLTSPGKMSADFCGGMRKKYFRPISFFLFIVVFYLVFPIFRGLDMKMDYYKALPVFGPIVTRQLESREASTGLSDAQFAVKFEDVAEKASKGCLLLLIVFSAPMLSLTFAKKRMPLYDHTILAIEINSFFLILFSLILPLFVIVVHAIYPASAALMTESDLVYVLLLSFLAYTIVAFRRFYGVAWGWSALASVAFVLVHMIFVFYIYKFILFEVTMVFA